MYSGSKVKTQPTEVFQSQLQYPSTALSLMGSQSMGQVSQFLPNPSTDNDSFSFNATSLFEQVTPRGTRVTEEEVSVNIRRNFYPTYRIPQCDKKICEIPVPRVQLNNCLDASGQLLPIFLSDLGLKCSPKPVCGTAYLPSNFNPACHGFESWTKITITGVDVSSIGIHPNQCHKRCIDLCRRNLQIIGLTLDVTCVANKYAINSALEVKFEDGFFFWRIKTGTHHSEVERLIRRFVLIFMVIDVTQACVVATIPVMWEQDIAVIDCHNNLPKDYSPAFGWYPPSIVQGSVTNQRFN